MSSRKKFVKQLAKERFEITDPCPVVLAGCQPPLFWSTVNNEKMLTSGFANRFFIALGDNYARARDYLDYKVPDAAVVDYLKSFDYSEYGPGTVNAIEGNRKTIELNDEAREYWRVKSNETYDIIDEAQRSANNIPNQIMIRDSFKAMKIAAIYAWLKDYNNPVIDLAAGKWAWYIIEKNSSALLKSIDEHSFASKDEQDTKRLIQLVCTKSKGMEMNDLRAKCASFALKFDAVFQYCINSRKITCGPEDRNGKTKMIVRVGDVIP